MEDLVKPSDALNLHRHAIRAIVKSHRAGNVRVFGSTARGEDEEGSDLDLVIDPSTEMTLFDIGAMRHELLLLLGVPVDVLTPNALPERFRSEVMAQAIPV
jgi:predicted nucleotidyltransferase